MPANDNTATTVAVSATPVPNAVAMAARQIVLWGTGYAVSRGWFGQSVADQLVPIAIALLIAGYGQVKEWVMHINLAKLAADPRNPGVVTK